ncbi:MAG: protease modulator HflC [Alphaproteobacteria bacterium]
MRVPALALVIGVVVALIVVTNTFFTVNEMQQAIVLQFGAPKNVVNAAVGRNGPGLYVKIPFVQNVVYFEKRIQTADMESLEVPDKERRRIVIDAFVRYQIVDPLQFYQTLGTELAGRQRMLTMLSSSLRDEMGKTTIFAVLSEERGTVMNAIKSSVNESSAGSGPSDKGLGIKVIDVRIRRADLPQQNVNSIIERMVAERSREASAARAEGDKINNTIQSQADRQATVILAEANKQSEIIRGEGDAERNRIYADAYSKDPEFFAFYRSMDAYKKALSEKDTTMVISPNSEFFKFLGDDKGK